MITTGKVYVYIANDRGYQIGEELRKGLRQKRYRLLNMIILGQRITDLGAVQPAGVMGFPKLDGPVRFAKPQIRFRDPAVDRLLTDLRIVVLVQQQAGLLQ